MNLDQLMNAIESVKEDELRIVEITYSDYELLFGQLSNEVMVSCDNLIFKFI